ncbi:alpha/beta hydrolase [Mycolicibacterium moriokaense]|nr:alpha/beta hydrolase [Mycolicibacterium moriokaense]
MVSGPATGRTIIMFDEGRNGRPYDLVRERLHVAMFRTVVIARSDELTPKAVVSILDQLKISAALLFADSRAGGLAWRLAGTYGARFTGLVVVDCGHPSVPDVHGEIRDTQCPPVEVDTTSLVSTPATHAVARASRRLVQGEFRLVELAGRRASRHFTMQVAAEIVVRALSR